MANEEHADLCTDYCVLRIRMYLSIDGNLAWIDGPTTEGQNDSLMIRKAPPGSCRLTGVYDVTGSFIPYFPTDLKGQAGIDEWLKSLQGKGFQLRKLF